MSVRTVLQEKELFLRQLRQMDLHDPMIRAAAAENVKVLLKLKIYAAYTVHVERTYVLLLMYCRTHAVLKTKYKLMSVRCTIACETCTRMHKSVHYCALCIAKLRDEQLRVDSVADWIDLACVLQHVCYYFSGPQSLVHVVS
jgi:hypothetical protein